MHYIASLQALNLVRNFKWNLNFEFSMIVDYIIILLIIIKLLMFTNVTFLKALVVKYVMTVSMETPWESTALPNSASPASVTGTWTRTLSAIVTAKQGSVGSALITAPAPSVRTVKMDTTTFTPQTPVRVQKNTVTLTSLNIMLQAVQNP